MKVFWPMVLVAIAVAIAGCKSGSQGEDESASADTSPTPTVSDSKDSDQPDSVVDIQFTRGKNAEENESRARQWFESSQQRLTDEIASLTKQVEAAASNEEKTRLYRNGNPVPVFVDHMTNLLRTFPETTAAFEGGLAALNYARGQEKDFVMNYLLDEWPDKLNHSQMVRSLLQEVPDAHIENWLRKIVATTPPGESHAEALLGFKTYFDQIPVFRSALRVNPQVAMKLPAEQLEYINRPYSDEQISEMNQYLELAIEQYTDLGYKDRGLAIGDTYGEVARLELYELNHLRVDLVAPEITGNDLDGTEFRLSDYRGKVVMLDFWGHWCPPCRKMYGHERDIVQRMAGLPFALIGVNSDRKIDTAKNSVRDEKLAWRNFWNGPEGTSGPIAREWNISAWPTVYLIDASGTIRYKGLLGEELDRAIEHLMAELGHDIDLRDGKLASTR